MEAKITLPVCLESYRPRKDKSFTLTFSTAEIREHEMIAISQLHGKIGALFFSEKNVIEENDLLKLDAIDREINNRSQAQRLRSVLYLLHQQNGGLKENFKAYYESETERIINHYKEKLV
jgi:hypothetical protein